MQKRTTLIFFVLIMILLAGCTAGQTEQDPKSLVNQFYSELLVYIGTPGQGEFHNPMSEYAYRSNPYLSPSFIKELDLLMEKEEGLVYDPLLCAQDVPQYLTASEAAVEGEEAVVLMTSNFPEQRFTVHLQHSEKGWLIDTIDCR